jgi:hypothetical protein
MRAGKSGGSRSPDLHRNMKLRRKLTPLDFDAAVDLGPCCYSIYSIERAGDLLPGLRQSKRRGRPTEIPVAGRSSSSEKVEMHEDCR